MKLKRRGTDSLESWIVCLMVSIIYMMMYGLARLCGVLFVFSMERYEANRKEASFPFVLCDFLQTTIGPLAGFLSLRIGTRWVVVLGCILATIGTGACFLAENIFTVTILWGVVFGAGFGLSTVISPVICKEHFIKYRATAMGLCIMGAYVGTAILPVLFDMFREMYGISGTFLLIGGMTMNCIPAALMLRKPNLRKSTSNDQILKQYADSNPTKCDKKGCNRDITEKNVYIIEPNLNKEEFSVFQAKGKSFQNHVSESTQEKCQYFSCNNCLNSTDKCRHNPHLMQYSSAPNHHQPSLESKNDNSSLDSNLSSNYSTHPKSNATNQNHNCREFNRLSSCCSASNKIQKEFELEKMPISKSKQSNFRLCLDPAFILIALANSAYQFSYIAFMAIIIDFSRDARIDTNNGQHVLLCLSIVGILSSAAIGYISDKTSMKSHTLTILSFLITAISNAIMPWVNNLTGLLILVAIWSLPGACLAFLIPLLTMNYISEEFHAVAVSSCHFLTGPLFLTISPLVGLFRDGLGSYDYIFYLLSVLLSVNCIALFFVPRVSKIKNNL